MKTRNWIAYRDDNPQHAPFYVEALPGQGGVDWGYTFEREKARKLSTRDVQRFLNHMCCLGKTGRAVPYSQ